MTLYRRSPRRREESSSIRTGTLTMLLLVTTTILAVVAVLALQTARSNEAQTASYTQTLTAYYANDAAAQELVAQVEDVLAAGGGERELREALPDGCALAGGGFGRESGVIYATFVDGEFSNAAALDSVLQFEDGIAASGLSETDVASVPALEVELEYGPDGCKVRAWNQTRAVAE